MYWVGAKQDWNIESSYVSDYDPRMPTRGFDQYWDDTGLHAAFVSKTPLDETFFYESTKPPPAPIDQSFWEATVSVISGLLLMVPYVGPALFAAGTAGGFIYHHSNHTRTLQETASKIEMLERDLFQRMKDRDLARISGTLASLKRAINACNEHHVFEKVSAKDRLIVEERYMDIRAHVFGTSDNSLEVMLEELMRAFRWGDNDIQQVMITIVPFMVQCMELKLILNANLATINRARGDDYSADEHEAAFYDGIEEIVYRLRDIGHTLDEWMTKQQKERLELFSTNVEQFDQNDKQLPIVPDRRTWKFTDHGSKRVFAVYGNKYTIRTNTREDDVNVKMVGYMGEMAAWYAVGLKDHTDRHFAMLRESIKKWGEVADHLNNHWKKEGRKEGALDGVRMYYQMCGIMQADDPVAPKAT